jgi:hypothetical protein
MVLHEITVGFTPVAEAHLKLLPREEQAKAVSYIKRITSTSFTKEVRSS